MIKIVCISDTHNRSNLPAIPECDILLHAGDATMDGKKMDEVVKFANWFGSDDIPAKHRVFVPGNHDFLFEENYHLAQEVMGNSAIKPITVLNQQSVTLEGLNIYGEPRQPWFYGWAFNIQHERMKLVWDLVPENTHIIVTHGPPHGYGDTTVRDGRSVGCPHQTKQILGSKNLKLVVCGHIHSGYGLYQCGSTIIANASVCNEQYRPVNPPLVIEL